MGAAALLALLPGCASVTLTDLTPNSLPDNPSEIYTFSLRITPHTNTIDKASITPKIVVDGQSFPMVKSAIGEDLYEFEYQLPPGRTEVAYYYLVGYKVEGNGQIQSGEEYTATQHAAIVRRYVLSLEAPRGPVGSRIGVLGRGFGPRDSIVLGGTPARTVFESPTSLSFFVPAVGTGRNYAVALSNPAGNSPVGTFRVDPIAVTASPASLNLATGAQATLTFSLSSPAPAGGLLLDVTTDVPESIIMPEVIVNQGATSATVTVQGGRPGTGSLFLKGYGPADLAIPVSVTGSGR